MADSLNFYFQKFILPMEILGDSNELNRKIADFDEKFESFVTNNTNHFMSKSSRALRDSLAVFTSHFVQDSNDTSYFATYVKYETAQLLYSLGLQNRNKMKWELFANKPIKYDNIGYMDCFNLIFENYIALGNKRMPPLAVERWLEKQQYETMIDSMGLDSTLRNEVFREFVFLKGMKDAFFTRGIERNNVIKMLDVFIGKTKFDRHKDIVNNLKVYLQSVSSGLEIEDLNLTNADGEKVKIRSFFKDKPTILCFIKVKNVVCRRELETIHLLYDKLKNSVNIVVICFDPSLDALYNFVKNNRVGSRYTFPFLHFDFNWEMFDRFHIIDFPIFVLVDKNGKILEMSLPKPSDMEGSIDETTDKYHSKWQRFIEQ